MSPRSAGVTCQFTVEMKARRILHEKTQRFLRGWWRTEEGVYINNEQRWKEAEGWRAWGEGRDTVEGWRRRSWGRVGWRVEVEAVQGGGCVQMEGVSGWRGGNGGLKVEGGRVEGWRVEGWKGGRVEGWKVREGWRWGEGWKGGRVEGWKGGRVEGWKGGRVKGGRVEGWKGGRVEGWKGGREGWEGGAVEGWKGGRVEGWKYLYPLMPLFLYSFIAFIHSWRWIYLYWFSLFSLSLLSLPILRVGEEGGLRISTRMFKNLGGPSRRLSDVV